jgi:hypothetical protein
MFPARVLIRSSAKPWPHWQSKNTAPNLADESRQVGLHLHLLMGLRPHLAFFFLLIAVSVQAAGQKQKQQYYLKPDQTADLAADTKLNTAKQSCENWAVAAGLETMLQRQNVPLDQSFWVMRLNGGELCVNDTPTIDALTPAVDKEFVLDDGRHVRLEIQFTPGPPVSIDSVIDGLKQQQVTLLLWRGHPYYLTGVTYDERIGRDGTRFFEVKEIRLANTYPKLPGVTFLKGRDDPAEIQGILSVSATQL